MDSASNAAVGGAGNLLAANRSDEVGGSSSGQQITHSTTGLSIVANTTSDRSHYMPQSELSALSQDAPLAVQRTGSETRGAPPSTASSPNALALSHSPSDHLSGTPEERLEVSSTNALGGSSLFPGRTPSAYRSGGAPGAEGRADNDRGRGDSDSEARSTHSEPSLVGAQWQESRGIVLPGSSAGSTSSSGHASPAISGRAAQPLAAAATRAENLIQDGYTSAMMAPYPAPAAAAGGRGSDAQLDPRAAAWSGRMPASSGGAGSEASNAWQAQSAAAAELDHRAVVWGHDASGAPTMYRGTEDWPVLHEHSGSTLTASSHGSSAHHTPASMAAAALGSILQGQNRGSPDAAWDAQSRQRGVAAPFPAPTATVASRGQVYPPLPPSGPALPAPTGMYGGASAIPAPSAYAVPMPASGSTIAINNAGPAYDAAWASIASRLHPFTVQGAAAARAAATSATGMAPPLSAVFERIELTSSPAPAAAVSALARDSCPVCLHNTVMGASPLLVLTCPAADAHQCVHVLHLECASTAHWVHTVAKPHAPPAAFRHASLVSLQAASADLANAAEAGSSSAAVYFRLAQAIGRCTVELNCSHVTSGGVAFAARAQDAMCAPVVSGDRVLMRFTLLDLASQGSPAAASAPAPGTLVAASGDLAILMQRGTLALTLFSYATNASWQVSFPFDLSSAAAEYTARTSMMGAANTGAGIHLEVADTQQGLSLSMLLLPVVSSQLSAAAADHQSAADAAAAEGFAALSVVNSLLKDVASMSARSVRIDRFRLVSAWLDLQPFAAEAVLRQSATSAAAAAAALSQVPRAAYNYLSAGSDSGGPGSRASSRTASVQSLPIPADGLDYPPYDLGSTSSGPTAVSTVGRTMPNRRGAYSDPSVDSLASRLGGASLSSVPAAVPAAAAAYGHGAYGRGTGFDVGAVPAAYGGYPAAATVNRTAPPPPPPSYGGSYGQQYGMPGRVLPHGPPGPIHGPNVPTASPRMRMMYDLGGQIAESAKTQSGSKFLQSQLMSGDPEVVAYVLDRVEFDLPELAQDLFGNYFLQALFRASNDAQRARFLRALQPALADIACDRNGTYALQSIVDSVSPDSQPQVASLKAGLSRDLGRIILNNNGTHVLQRFLKRFAPVQCDFIHEWVRADVGHLIAHANGVGVVLLTIDTADRNTRSHILAYILRNCVALAQHPMGNYAVSHLLGKRSRSLRIGSFPGLAEALSNHSREHSPLDAPPTMPTQHPLFDETADALRPMWLAAAVCRCLRGRVVELSRGKYSSNVIEKCVTWGATERVYVLEEIFLKGNLRDLLCDGFSNYVIQTALQTLHPRERRQVVMLVQPHLDVFSRPGVPAAVQSKWVSLCAKLLANSPPDSESSMAPLGTLPAADPTSTELKLISNADSDGLEGGDGVDYSPAASSAYASHGGGYGGSASPPAMGRDQYGSSAGVDPMMYGAPAPAPRYSPPAGPASGAGAGYGYGAAPAAAAEYGTNSSGYGSSYAGGAGYGVTASHHVQQTQQSASGAYGGRPQQQPQQLQSGGAWYR